MEQVPNMGITDLSQIYNKNLIEFLEFKNSLELSRVVVLSAIKREESRGGHYRSDFQEESQEIKHTFVKDGVVL